MKKAILATALILGLATAGLVYAHGGGYGGGYGTGGGYGMMGPGYGMGGGYGMMGPGYGMGGGYGMMGPGYGMGGGYGMMGYGGYSCPGYGWNRGQNGWNNERTQKFLNDTVQLRKQLNDKEFMYREALRNPNTTRENLAKIEKDIIDLRTQIYNKAQQER